MLLQTEKIILLSLQFDVKVTLFQVPSILKSENFKIDKLITNKLTMNDNLGILCVLCGCVIIVSLVCEVGAQQRSRSRTPKPRQQQTTEAPSNS